MNLKKLKLLLPLSVLSTSFVFSSVSAMEPKPKTILEPFYLSSVSLYVPQSEIGKLVQVSKKVRDVHIFGPEIKAWEEFVDLALRRNSCKERIPVDDFDKFQTVRKQFINKDGEPSTTGFNNCLFVESFDKPMIPLHLMYKAISEINNLERTYVDADKAKVFVNKAKKIIDNSLIELMNSKIKIEDIKDDFFYKVLSHRKMVLENNEYSDIDKIDQVQGICRNYDPDTDVYSEISSIDTFDENVDIIREYLDLEECPYHEEMNDELKDKVLKSCVFSISGNDTQFVYPRTNRLPNDNEKRKICEIVKFLARKFYKDKCFNNCYRAFSDKKASAYNFFNFDLDMYLTDDNFKDKHFKNENEKNRNEFLDMFLRSCHNSYFYSYQKLNLEDSADSEDGRDSMEFEDHAIREHGLFNDAEFIPFIYDGEEKSFPISSKELLQRYINLTTNYYDDEYIDSFLKHTESDGSYSDSYLDEIDADFCCRIHDMYEKYKGRDIYNSGYDSNHMEQMFKTLSKLIATNIRNINKLKRDFINRLNERIIQCDIDKKDIIYRNDGNHIERIKIDYDTILRKLRYGDNYDIFDKVNLENCINIMRKRINDMSYFVKRSIIEGTIRHMMEIHKKLPDDYKSGINIEVQNDILSFLKGEKEGLAVNTFITLCKYEYILKNK